MHKNRESCFVQLSQFLLPAIEFNSFRNKFRSAFTVAVNIVLEPLVADVHLTKSCEDFIGAMIKIRGDVVLQFLYEPLSRFAVGALAAFLHSTNSAKTPFIPARTSFHFSLE